MSAFVGSDDDNNAEEEEYGVASIGKNKHTRTRTGCGGFGKGMVLRQFAIAKRKFRRVRSKRALLPPSSSENATTTTTGSGKNKKMIIRGDGNGDDRRSGFGCKFCFLQPKVLESLDGSPTSDPNHPNFTNSMLRILIENNDFYSKDCNPHLD